MWDKKQCVSRLQQAAAELGRLPHKADLPLEEMIAIKQQLGPWPRALEAAGLKPVSKRKKVQMRLQKQKEE